MKKIFLIGWILLVGTVSSAADTSICIFREGVKTSAQKNLEAVRQEAAEKHNSVIEPLQKQLRSAEKGIMELQEEIQKSEDKEFVKGKQEELDKKVQEYRELTGKFKKTVAESVKKFEEKHRAMEEKFVTKMRKVVDAISEEKSCSVTLPGGLVLYHSSSKEGVLDVTEEVVEKMNKEMPRVEE